MTDLERLIAEALAEEFTEPLMRNPAWNRKAEWAAWKADEEYDVPEMIPAPMEARVKRGIMCHTTGPDGGPVMWSPSIAHVAAVVARRIEHGEVEQP